MAKQTQDTVADDGLVSPNSDYPVAGEKIPMGGKSYILPPMPLIKMAAAKPFMEGGDPMSEASISALVECLHASLARNYTTIRKEFVQINLDTSNYQAVFEAFITVNRMTPRTAAPEGEAPAQ